MSPKSVTKIKVSTAKNKKNSSKKSISIKEEDTFKQAPVFNTSLAHGHASAKELKDKKLTDRSRNLIMYIGISVIMVAIVTFWILNLKKMMGPDAFSVVSGKSASKQDFNSIKSELDNSFSQFKQGVDKLKELGVTKTATPTSTLAPLVVPTKTVTPGVTSTTLPNTLPK